MGGLLGRGPECSGVPSRLPAAPPGFQEGPAASTLCECRAAAVPCRRSHGCAKTRPRAAAHPVPTLRMGVSRGLGTRLQPAARLGGARFTHLVLPHHAGRLRGLLLPGGPLLHHGECLLSRARGRRCVRRLGDRRGGRQAHRLDIWGRRSEAGRGLRCSWRGPLSERFRCGVRGEGWRLEGVGRAATLKALASRLEDMAGVEEEGAGLAS